MDPNACLQRWRDARTKREQREAAADLIGWIMRGGFEPDWRPGERAAILGTSDARA